ncbi:MAG: HAD-IA family hydrolase [Planctomycetes bacterium]|nr:HAD-IA family hydrolase [Planctomycetota bacterium]
MYKAVMFDLDGTLLDTLTDLANATNRALQDQGFPTHPVGAYRHFIGDGVAKLMERVLPPEHRDPGDVEVGGRLMKQAYAACWSENSAPYPGITDLLDKLSQARMPMAILSNKPDEFIQVMVKTLLPDWDFVMVRGALPDVPIKPDPMAALVMLRELGVTPSQCLYVGDTSTDIKTAINAGMCPVGVAWGFRDEQELIQSGAQATLHRPDELMSLLNRSG